MIDTPREFEANDENSHAGNISQGQYPSYNLKSLVNHYPLALKQSPLVSKPLPNVG